ncbi:hypothetical protein OpiT1DRAFT_00200 [Opitutaceae bacterium TAV1]|nr:hypothetical protein OpiT1DRAFT_00200 [Opitutaceae bacterium TAV1]
MLTLFQTARQHPLAVSIVGASGGAFSWIITWGEELALIFRLVGGFFGALLAIASFLFVLPRLLRFLRGWRRNGISKADTE